MPVWNEELQQWGYYYWEEVPEPVWYGIDRSMSNYRYAIKTDILMKARVLLANEKCWIKNFNWAYRTTTGEVVPRPQKYANCWCPYGALIMAVNEGNAIGYLDELFGEAKIQELIEFNDQPETTHDDILRYIDRLITETIPVEEGRIDFD